MSLKPDDNQPRALLPRWANEQDSWTRAIVSDVLRNRVRPSDGDVDRYLGILLAEKKLSDEKLEPEPKIEEKELGTNPLDPVRLDFVKVLDGVNAIRANTQIEFASGVTVIFGENGSGKSGFVRVMKRAAGVRTAEDILHNVRSASRPVPQAMFGATVGTAIKTVAWKNEFGIAPVNRATVFDARGARVHVEEDLTYAYSPGELTLFPLTQDTIERVRGNLERAISLRSPGPNTLLLSFDRACSIYSTIETLGAASDIDEIRKYATLPQDVDGTIESLRTEIDALRSSGTQNLLRRVRDRAAVVESFRAALEAAGALDIARYDSLVETYSNAARRHEEAGAKAFETRDIPGILTEEWRALVEAGEAYLKKHASDGYPHDTDSCVYCRQPLNREAVALVRKYRDFTNNEIRNAADAADTALREYVAPLMALDLETLRQDLGAESSAEGDVLATLAPVVAQIGATAVSVSARTPVIWSDKQKQIDAGQQVIAAEAKRLASHALELQASHEKRQDALKRKQSELTELSGKKTTASLLTQIEKRVADDKWVSKASIVKNGITGILRSLTETAKQASEELLNRGFEKRFKDECTRLRAPNVTLNFPGRQGQVTRRKLVANHKPSEVLSEGEQKALALADFLAEVTAVPASSPIIFDDPITSMDYRRIHEVSDRIVDLATSHQVIVFTHNIWFAAELLAKADKKSWKYYDIRSEASEAGVVSSASHPRVDTTAQVSASVKKMIDGAEKADGEIKAALIEKGYEHLRGLCEIVVEHEMLKGVVQRYAPNVMMGKVEKINIGKLQESTSVVLPVFEKACRYIASHSQPIETQGIRPTLDELKRDYEAVMKAREPHKE